jgi:hypothetical protein
MSTLFDIALILFGTNLLLSLVLFARLCNESICEQLFALPNSFLGTRPRYLSLQLLRLKFYLPWVKAPLEMDSQAGWIRLAFWLARISGTSFFIVIIAFFVSLFVVA